MNAGSNPLTLGSTTLTLARFDKINDRFDALSRNLIGVATVIIAALIGVNVP